MSEADDNVLVISAGHGERRYWLDLWHHRNLLLLLARKELLIRYKEMAIGIGWVLLKPALTLLIFTLVFGNLAKLPSDNAPYAIMVFAGLLPWLFFASAISDSGECLISNASLLTKVYFPRAILPASAILVCLIDFLVAALLFVPLALFFGAYPDWRMCVLPLLIALLCVTVAGLGLWLAALSVEYRDFKYITPFIVQLSLYASPVGYASSIVPEPWRALFYLNPLAGIIDGFRWALLAGKTQIYAYGLAMSVVLGLLLFVTGMIFFRKIDRTLADRL